MGLRSTFKGAGTRDESAMSVDAADHSEGLANVRRAQRDLIAIAQRDETNRLLAEQNDLLRALLSRP